MYVCMYVRYTYVRLLYSDDSHEHAGEEWRMLCRKGKSSVGDKDEYGSDSDKGRVFHVDYATTAKLHGT